MPPTDRHGGRHTVVPTSAIASFRASASTATVLTVSSSLGPIVAVEELLDEFDRVETLTGGAEVLRGDILGVVDDAVSIDTVSGCRARSSGCVRRRDSRVRAHRPRQPGRRSLKTVNDGGRRRQPPVAPWAMSSSGCRRRSCHRWRARCRVGGGKRGQRRRRRRSPHVSSDVVHPVTSRTRPWCRRSRATAPAGADVMPHPLGRRRSGRSRCRRTAARRPSLTFAVNTTVPGFTPYIRISRWAAPPIRREDRCPGTRTDADRRRNHKGRPRR